MGEETREHFLFIFQGDEITITSRTVLVKKSLNVITYMFTNKYMSSGDTVERKQTLYKTVKVDSLDIFYGEAEQREASTILLLHRFPTSAPLVRNLIMRLSNENLI